MIDVKRLEALREWHLVQCSKIDPVGSAEWMLHSRFAATVADAIAALKVPENLPPSALLGFALAVNGATAKRLDDAGDSHEG